MAVFIDQEDRELEMRLLHEELPVDLDFGPDAGRMQKLDELPSRLLIVILSVQQITMFRMFCNKRQLQNLMLRSDLFERHLDDWLVNRPHDGRLTIHMTSHIEITREQLSPFLLDLMGEDNFSYVETSPEIVVDVSHWLMGEGLIVKYLKRNDYYVIYARVLTYLLNKFDYQYILIRGVVCYLCRKYYLAMSDFKRLLYDQVDQPGHHHYEIYEVRMALYRLGIGKRPVYSVCPSNKTGAHGHEHLDF